MGWWNGIAAKLSGVDPNQAMDHAARGFSAIGTMIDERKFTEEERSKANANLVADALEFQRVNTGQNAERSKARRDIASRWIKIYLERLIPFYLLVVTLNVFYPRLQSIIVSMEGILKMMGTGTLMVLGFFFGTHLVRSGLGALNGKKK